MFDVGGILFGEVDEDADYLIDERCATVADLLPKLKSKLQWTYDFGDGWEHDVVVEAIESPQEGKRYPLCLDGGRPCPPKDCGGVPGYAAPLRVLADPNDDEHDHGVSWAPEGFDPNAFDLMAAKTEDARTMSRHLFQPGIPRMNEHPPPPSRVPANWNEGVMTTRAGRYERQVTGYRAFVPKPLPPDPSHRWETDLPRSL